MGPRRQWKGEAAFMTGARVIEGTGSAAGLRFALVVSRYNDFVTDRLQAGAIAALTAAGAAAEDLVVVRVPGAFEIPIAARHAAQQGGFAAVVCLRLHRSGSNASLRIPRVGGRSRDRNGGWSDGRPDGLRRC